MKKYDNIYIYTDDFKNSHKTHKLNIHNLKDDDINTSYIKNIDILIIDKENDELFKITKKIKIIVFTNIVKYCNETEYVYYKNKNELMKYFKIINDNLDKSFTIIVPVCNSYGYLDKCINSILNQTINNFKIFICDDFSNIDDFNKYKNKYSNISNISMFRNTSNLGKYLTINKVLSIVDTDYYLIVDSDDIINKNRLLYDLINLNDSEQNNIYCVQSKYIRYDVNSKNIIENNYGHNIVTFKTNIISKIGYYCPNRFGSDSEYIMRIMKFISNKAIKKYNKITYIAHIKNDKSNLTIVYDTNQRKLFIDRVINIHSNIINTDIFFDVKNDYFNLKIEHSDTLELNINEYKKFYLDVRELNDTQILKHWNNKGINEGRLPNLLAFYYHYPNFNYKLYRKKNKDFYDKYEIYGWIYLKNKEKYSNWLVKNNLKLNLKLNFTDSKQIQHTDNDIKCDFAKYISDNAIKYICVSDALIHFESRMCNKFNLIKYNKLCDKFENVLFFGLYNNSDYKKITNHIGKKYLMWGGTDTNTKYVFREEILQKIKNYYDMIYLNPLKKQENQFIYIMDMFQVMRKYMANQFIRM
jgi:glycosyltransferase involved in cell wall biosynthesis